MAHRGFGPTAEQDFRAALADDPLNVFANGMLGHWVVLKETEVSEGVKHFNIAVATRKARPYVRKLQLGSLVYLDKEGSRTELVKVVNDMRKSNGPLDEENKNRVLEWCFDPTATEP